MRHAMCTLLLLASVWAQPAILGTISITGGATSLDMPTSALSGTSSPAAIGRLQNNTGFQANDVTIRIEPAPGCTGSAPRIHDLSVGGQHFNYPLGVGETRVNIPALPHSGSCPISIATCGVATASSVRISVVLSAAPPWVPEFDIIAPVLVAVDNPVATQVLPFQGDEGVLFWLENAASDPSGVLTGVDIAFDFNGAPNSVIQVWVLDEFSLLPVPGVVIDFKGTVASLRGTPLLDPLQRLAIAVQFKREPTSGLGVAVNAH